MPEPLRLRSDPAGLTTRSMVLRPDSLNEELRTVDAVIATERETIAFDMRRSRPVAEILRMEGVELPDQIPLLDTHQRDSIERIVGSIRNIRVEQVGNERQLVGTLRFAEDDLSLRAFRKVRDGHLRDVSTGNLPVDFVELPPNTTRSVDGQQYRSGALPLVITRRWRPREASLTAIGADPTARVRTQPHQEISAVNERLRRYLEQLGLRAEATDVQTEAFRRGLTENQRAVADVLAQEDLSEVVRSAALRGLNVNPAEPWSELAITIRSEDDVQSEETLRREAVTTERQRVARLRELAGDDVPAELRTRAETEGWDEARASREFLAAVRERRTPAVGPGIHSRSRDTDCNVRSLGMGLMLREGLDPIRHAARYEEGQYRPYSQVERDSPEMHRAAEAAWRYRDMSLVDICREAIRLDGRTPPHSRGEMIRAAVSGSALTNIFTTNVGAQLLQGYNDAMDTTIGWCSEADVANFLTQERPQMGKFGALKKHTRGETAKHLELSDSSESYKIGRYAGQFVVDEMDIIDDRLGALDQVAPQDIGLTAKQLRANLVYAILLANGNLSDDGALFNATAITTAGGHANSTTGALAASTLQTAIQLMSKQRIRNRPLNLRPRFLLVPQDLFFTAQILLTSAERVVSSSEGTKNPLLGLGIEMRADDRLGVAGVTDPATGTAHAGTATNYFLAARPGEEGAKTIEVGYLRGTGRAPQMRSFVLTQGQWGVGWDINMDIGAKAIDFRGLVHSTGA